MPRFLRPRWAPALAAAAALALTAGCSGDDAPDPSPSADSSTSSSGSSTPSPEPTPTVEPASGPVLEMPAFAFHAPQGWRLRPKIVDFNLSAQDPRSGGLMTISDQSLPGLEETVPLGELARTSIRSAGWLREPSVAAPRTVQGVRLYHVAGRVSPVEWVDEFGGFYEDRLVSIQILQDLTDEPADRRAVVESVLASVVWK